MPEDQSPPRRVRPPGIVIAVCALLGFFALLTALVTLLVWLALQRQSGGPVTGGDWATLLVNGAVALAYAATAVYLYRGRPWARWTGVGLTILGLANQLLGGINLFSLVVQAVMLFLLFRVETRQWVARTSS